MGYVNSINKYAVWGLNAIYKCGYTAVMFNGQMTPSEFNMTPTSKKIADIELQIARIEHNADSYIGGAKAYYSGAQTFLKPAAQRKVDSLNKQLDKLLDSVEC